MYCSRSRFLVVFSALLYGFHLYGSPAHAQVSAKQWIEKASVAPPVSGQQRLALIIGNTHYGGSYELKNPDNDARAVSKALSNLGFTSTVVLDGSLNDMSDALHTFSEKIRAAGSSAVALLYYSGHGIQIKGENYLLPVGFKMPTNERDMVRYALSAQSALDEMQAANAQINIAVLDACRNNPFEGSRSAVGKGLAKLETQGMLIAFATAAGKTASDNTEGENGLYTTALLKYLQTPGLRLYDIFKSTSKAVYEASKHEQFPYLYDGLIDGTDFYLLPANTAIAPIKNEASNVTPVTTGIATKVKINPIDGAEMILIPAGEFLMGEDKRRVNMSGYYIYKNMVTVAMYEKFCRETRHSMPPAPSFDPNWSQKDHPIVNVPWEDAKAYCQWIGGDLPTEAQWEKAARGTQGQRYPWGNEFDRSKLWCSKSVEEDAGGTAAVGSFPAGASPYGCLDMAGNTWQWCRDYFYTDFWNSRTTTGTDPINNALNARGNRSLKGGSWIFTNSLEFLCTNRNKSAPATAGRGRIGFRCIYPAN